MIEPALRATDRVVPVARKAGSYVFQRSPHVPLRFTWGLTLKLLRSGEQALELVSYLLSPISYLFSLALFSCSFLSSLVSCLLSPLLPFSLIKAAAPSRSSRCACR